MDKDKETTMRVRFPASEQSTLTSKVTVSALESLDSSFMKVTGPEGKKKSRKPRSLSIRSSTDSDDIWNKLDFATVLKNGKLCRRSKSGGMYA